MRKCQSLPYLLLADLAKRFGLMLAAQSIGLALAFAAPAGAQEISPRQETPAIRPHMQEQPQIQGDESTLVLPKLVGPHLPSPPSPIESPKVPSVYQGCWQGDPGEFDWVNTDTGVAAIGVPGKITFCYSESEISVPEAEVRISPGAHALDWLLHLGLGFRTFSARGITTEIYAITPTRMRGRSSWPGLLAAKQGTGALICRHV
jgi:hypothetical protein